MSEDRTLLVDVLAMMDVGLRPDQHYALRQRIVNYLNQSPVTVEKFADDIGAAFDTIPGCDYPDTANNTIDCWKELAERLAMEYDFIRKLT